MYGILEEPLPTVSDHQYVVLDLETTGLDPEQDSIVEVAALRFRGAQLQDAFQSLVNPGRRIPPEASAIHLIGNDDVIHAPEWAAVQPELQRFIGGDAIVSHNAPFDSSFLPALKDRLWLCSLRFARHLFPDAGSYGNMFLRFYLGIRDPLLRGIAAHRAAGDAAVTGLVFYEELRAFELLDERATSLDDVARFIAQPVTVTTFRYGKKHRNRDLGKIPTDYLSWALAYTQTPDGQRYMPLDPDTVAAVEAELRRRLEP